MALNAGSGPNMATSDTLLCEKQLSLSVVPGGQGDVPREPFYTETEMKNFYLVLGLLGVAALLIIVGIMIGATT